MHNAQCVMHNGEIPRFAGKDAAGGRIQGKKRENGFAIFSFLFSFCPKFTSFRAIARNLLMYFSILKIGNLAEYRINTIFGQPIYKE